MKKIIKFFNDSIRFSLELITIGLIITAALKANTMALKVIFSIGLPFCAILFWNKFMAPASPNRFNEFQRIVTEIILFGGVGFTTFLVGNKKIALVYLFIATINTIFEHIL